jgi:PAS domain S-box-containing protein
MLDLKSITNGAAFAGFPDELQRSKNQLEEELADARLLQRLSMELVHEEGVQALYQKIMDAAVAIMRSQYASMQSLHPLPGTIGKLKLLACSGFSPEAEKYWEWVFPTTNSSCGAALRARKRVVIENMSTCEFMQGTDTLPLFISSGIFAAQSTPLFSRGGKLLGMITTHWDHPHKPSERDLNLLDILARQAADLIERNQTAEALRQSEERLRALTTATSDVLYRMSADWAIMYELDGRNFLNDTGEPIADWIEKYIPACDHHKVLNKITEAIHNRSVFQIEHQAIKADQTIGWVFSRAIPILDAGGNIIEWFGAASDVTERKQAEDALTVAREDSERRKRLYETITASTPDLIYVFDLNYRFTYANEALLKMWGRNWDQSIGCRLLELGYEPWHAEMHEREIDEVVRTKKSIRGEVFFPHATLGRRSYDYIFVPVLNEAGEVEAVAGTTRDITELKSFEEALKESEAKFRRFYESNMLPIAFWNVDGTIYECNEAYARLVGCTTTEIANGNFNWRKNVAPEWKALNEEGVKLAIAKGEFIDPYEMELIRKDGQRTSVVAGYTMLEGSKDKGVAFLLDISEQKSLMNKLEKRVEERTRELQRSNEDLQQFAHVASHDLKEPVRKIKTYGYRLHDIAVKSADPKTTLYIERILGSAERMSSMIDGVLTYSLVNGAEPRIENINLNDILTDIQNDLEILISQKQATIKHDPLPNIKGVQVLIYQLFYNLINNSLKFSKANQKPLILITAESDSAYWIIKITDNGIGFEPDYNNRIFDTFTRLNSRDRYDGTGLGLSLCRKIVERHHGTIEACGKENVGAVFTIALPHDHPA